MVVPRNKSREKVSPNRLKIELRCQTRLMVKIAYIAIEPSEIEGSDKERRCDKTSESN